MTDWLEPSELGNAIEAEYLRHVEAMKPCAELPVRKAFALDSGSIVGILRKVAETYDGKKIAVIDHGTGFEVRRFDDWFDLATFYALSSGPKQVEAITEPIADSSANFPEKALIKMIAVIREVWEVDELQLRTYDGRMSKAREFDCVSARYLTLRLSQISVFRKSEIGPRAELKRVIGKLTEQGILTKLDASEAQAIIQSSATLYKVNRDLL
jgi:hypothetical protein